MNSRTISYVKEKMQLLFAVGISVVLLFFFIIASAIGYEVKRQCRQATAEYSGDCVESLSALLKDEHKSYASRNDAIWALGQIGEEKALPALNNYYTGNIPDREPLSEVISQYELQKAIKLASGGTNITAFVWRWMIK